MTNFEYMHGCTKQQCTRMETEKLQNNLYYNKLCHLRPAFLYLKYTIIESDSVIVMFVCFSAWLRHHDMVLKEHEKHQMQMSIAANHYCDNLKRKITIKWKISFLCIIILAEVHSIDIIIMI